MAEARRLLELEAGRTGFADPASIMVAGMVAAGTARVIHNNSAVVRGMVAAAKNRFVKKLPPGELVLPFGWERRHTKVGMMYVNSKTGETRNTPPPDSYEEHVGEDGKTYWHSDGLNKTVFVRPGGPAPPPPPPDPDALPTNWTEHEHNGKKYYYNTQTGLSQHDRPTATPTHPVAAEPVTQTKSKKNRSKQSAAVAPIEQAPTQPTPKKGQNKQSAGAPRIDYFSAPKKKAHQILGSDALTKLITKLETAVKALQKRIPEVETFVATNYKSSIEKYDVEALKAEGLKRRPAIVYTGAIKTDILALLVQAESDACHDLVTSWKTAVQANETELTTLQATIATAGNTPDAQVPEKNIFQPVIAGLEVFTKKLATTTTAYKQLKVKLGKPGNSLMTMVLGSISACRAVVLQYMSDLAKMRK